jgi:hypothetical protein
MPYASPERRKQYNRDYSRSRPRVRVGQTPMRSPLPHEFRLRTATDVVTELAKEVAAVRADAEAKVTEKARVVGYLLGIALQAVEVADLSERVAAMESALKERKGATCPSQDWPTLTPS